MHKIAGIYRPFLQSLWTLACWFFICISFESCSIWENVNCHLIFFSNGFEPLSLALKEWNKFQKPETKVGKIFGIWRMNVVLTRVQVITVIYGARLKVCYCVLGLDVFYSISSLLVQFFLSAFIQVSFCCSVKGSLKYVKSVTVLN
jgi:hypothetical protein